MVYTVKALSAYAENNSIERYKTMKRITALIMAVALCLGIFCACGKREEFVIGITYFEPMNYFDDANKLVGFETEFAEAVCKELGLTPKFQEINWSAKETELNAGNIDCIWNGMTITEDRKANMGISNPYMENKQVLVVKAENLAKFSTAEGLKGAKLCAEKESAGETTIIGNEADKIAAEKVFADAEVQYTAVDTMAKAIMEVKSGTSDGCVVDFVTSIGMIGEGTDFEDLVVVEAYEFAVENYGIAFRKADTDTIKKFNDAIDKLMKDGTIDAIAKKYKLEGQLIKGE